MATLAHPPDNAMASVHDLSAGSALITPLAKAPSPSEDSVLLATVRSIALVALAFLLVFALLPALLGAVAPGTLAAI